MQAIFWKHNQLHILDQRRLPKKRIYIPCRSHQQVAKAIQDMVVRGAPLIGCTAAYGMLLAAWETKTKSHTSSLKFIKQAANKLKSARPTALALSYAVNRMLTRAETAPPSEKGSDSILQALKSEADILFQEDLQANRKMADWGATLLPNAATVITYCNTGALATSGIGTALGVIRKAFHLGKIKKVYACETRPYLQGSRLTLWELMVENIPSILITDNMAAHLMKTEKIDAVLTGADRIAANGDTANKIGTYALAIQARHHEIPFYVVAPTPTIDLHISSGEEIPIEERSPAEVTQIGSQHIAPQRAQARHPAFDVTPHKLITALITEKGILQPPDSTSIAKLNGLK
ncbi:MAG: S-methyl-5-thioribose-1-phosphate isomerase [Elusimicrobia bacterium]|nr:S-methyl-5-thioribose-1-phosphate isomerase [Elusimicrobiota bacterium]